MPAAPRFRASDGKTPTPARPVGGFQLDSKAGRHRPNEEPSPARSGRSIAHAPRNIAATDEAITRDGLSPVQDEIGVRAQEPHHAGDAGRVNPRVYKRAGP